MTDPTLTPIARLTLIAELLEGVPVTAPRLFLGVDDAAMGFLLSLGGAGRISRHPGTPDMHGGAAYEIESVALKVGGLLVEAQRWSRPMSAPPPPVEAEHIDFSQI